MDLTPDATFYEPRVDPDYFLALVDILDQATPEKPKSRLAQLWAVLQPG
jgi:hypothetical protein